MCRACDEQVGGAQLKMEEHVPNRWRACDVQLGGTHLKMEEQVPSM